MQIFVRGAAELIPLELEKDDTVQDIRVCHISTINRSKFCYDSFCFIGIRC